MAKYVYPAIFKLCPEERRNIAVRFVDFPSCFTDGDGIENALEMAEDALCLVLYLMEKDNDEIPLPSDPFNLKVKEDEIITLVSCDTDYYKNFYANKRNK